MQIPDYQYNDTDLILNLQTHHYIFLNEIFGQNVTQQCNKSDGYRPFRQLLF